MLFLLRISVTSATGGFGIGVTPLDTRIPTNLAFLAYLAASLIDIRLFG